MVVWRVLPGMLPAWLCRAEIPASWGEPIPGLLRGRFGVGVCPSAAPGSLPKPTPQRGDGVL